jgi:L-ascorbate metabolism protein UlaG (beta-lactamase superfamily)
VLALGGTALLTCSAGDRFTLASAETRKARMNRSPNYDGEQFINPTATTFTPSAGGIWDVTSRYLFGKEERVPRGMLPVAPLSRGAFDTPAPGGLRTTWLGHSTVLVEVDGHRVLTDPVWSQRASPTQWFGPGRFHPVPLSVEDLPPLDAVVISHDHYDHLDRAAIEALAPSGVAFVVPLGVGSHLRKWGVAAAQVTELDWWEETTVGEGLRLVATPARHFSGRGLLDRNATLWASFAILGAGHRVYFGGDSGLFAGMAEIGERLGPFDINLLEIGASDRTWPEIHLGPENAVEAHRLLRGRLLQPIHWGTFNLALHNWFDPPTQLVEAADQAGVRLAVPRPGEQVAAAPTPAVWWWDGVREDQPAVAAGQPG